MSTDDILDLLTDDRWHEIGEIVETLHQPEHLIHTLLCFYEKFAFIQFDPPRTKVLIDPKVRDFFRALPTP